MEPPRSPSDSWRRHPHAPALGTSLGPLESIPDGTARAFDFGEGRRVFSLLIVHCGATARAYLNVCPHQWLPLTHRSANVVSQDRERLRCSNHFAEFSVADGRVLAGPAPIGLYPVPVHVDARGEIVIGDRPPDATPSAPASDGA